MREHVNPYLAGVYATAPRGGLDAVLFQREFVAARRAAGVSWQNIANMLARPTISVRKQFDPAFVEPATSSVSEVAHG